LTTATEKVFESEIVLNIKEMVSLNFVGVKGFSTRMVVLFHVFLKVIIGIMILGIIIVDHHVQHLKIIVVNDKSNTYN